MIKHLSPSSLETYGQCPLKWKFQYIDKRREPPSYAAVLGTFIHEILEGLMKLGGTERTLASAKEIAKGAWSATLTDPNQVLGLNLDKGGLSKFKHEAWRKVTSLWDIEDPTSVEVVATEQVIQVDIAGVPFKGIIDRLDIHEGKLRVSDYKSGKAPAPRFVEGRLAQLYLYARALREEGHDPAYVNLIYLGSTSIEGSVTNRKLGMQETRLRVAWESIENSLESEQWTPEPGPLCGWCPFVLECTPGAVEVRRRFGEGRMRADAPAVAALELS